MVMRGKTINLDSKGGNLEIDAGDVLRLDSPQIIVNPRQGQQIQ